MKITRIQIKNFRNFEQLDVAVNGDAVIVGENKVGKSNLLYALRLILDPNLPESDRLLRMEDFWDGLERPLSRDDRIEISIVLSEFEDNPSIVAYIGTYLIQPEPMVAQLTYVFQPKATLEHEPVAEADYEYFVYGGGRTEARVDYEVRRRLPLDLLPALRDTAGDLNSWRKSPLRPLLDEVAGAIDQEELRNIADAIEEATDKVTANEKVEQLADDINERLEEMVGKSHAIETEFGFSPTDPERMLRA